MKKILLGLMLISSINAFALNDQDIIKCNEEIKTIIKLNEKINKIEGPLSNIFFAAIRGYVYEATSCDEVSFGLNKIKRGLENIN